jgi:predicted ATP-grasp superfamily ATP-dependent carboligase
VNIDNSVHPSDRPPILLANADYYGTLAATRSLGAEGVPVVVASDRLLAVSRWSRHARRTVACPPIADADRFLDWLCEFGRQQPGMVLCPTSDETAYLYALRATDLSGVFRTYQPPLDAIVHVLDKKRLYATARDVGLDVPETWHPETEADVARIAREAPMPVLIKPRTQVLSRTHSKGIIVRKASELVARYREFVDGCRYGRALLSQIPDAAQAMIQRYVPSAAHQIYVLAAFVDPEAGLVAARSGMKIFQLPRTLGVGLCFENAPLDAGLTAGLRRLAGAIGHRGILQLEFIRDRDRYLLIDSNPRLYNQLAFDAARGLLLPQIMYAAARGKRDEVARLIAHAAAGDPHRGAGLVFCNDFGMNVMLRTHRFVGRMSASEARSWRAWRRRHAGSTIDPTHATDDPVPRFVDMAAQVYGFARHPRAFIRKVVFDRTVV